MNTIDALAGGNILKWDDVLYTPYSDVFTKLMMNKTHIEIQRRYAAQRKSEAEAASRKNRYK